MKVPAPEGHIGEPVKLAVTVVVPVALVPDVTSNELPVQLVLTITLNVVPTHEADAVIFSLMQLHCASLLPAAQLTL